MRDFSQPRTFILSGQLAHATDEANLRAHNELASDLALDGVPFTECSGTYDGLAELGYIVTGAEHQSTIERLAHEYGQQSFLLVAEHDRAAYLVDRDGYHEHIGTLVHAGIVPPEHGDWTQVGDQYFTTEVRGPLQNLSGGL